MQSLAYRVSMSNSFWAGTDYDPLSECEREAKDCTPPTPVVGHAVSALIGEEARRTGLGTHRERTTLEPAARPIRVWRTDGKRPRGLFHRQPDPLSVRLESHRSFAASESATDRLGALAPRETAQNSHIDSAPGTALFHWENLAVERRSVLNENNPDGIATDLHGNRRRACIDRVGLSSTRDPAR